MSWYEVDLPRFGNGAMVFGETKTFGLVTTVVHPKPRNEGFWFARGTWDVAYRILICPKNISINNGARLVAVELARRSFKDLNGREPDADELKALTAETLSACDELGNREQSVDGAYNHEWMHVVAVASCIAFDAHSGELRKLVEALHNGLWGSRKSAEAFAAAWERDVMARLRTLAQRAAGHEGAGIAAGIGGITGVLLGAVGVGLQPPAGTSVTGKPAPARLGGPAEWNAELLDLGNGGYDDLMLR